MKIISGGQTGVDRAALDVARGLGLDYGGFIPRGRKAEDGPIDPAYDRLTELDSDLYRVRTEKNVIEGDATLVLTRGAPTEGTAYTVACAEKHRRPYLVIDMEAGDDRGIVEAVQGWLGSVRPSVLNVAGPRESKSPGIYGQTRRLLHSILSP